MLQWMKSFNFFPDVIRIVLFALALLHELSKGSHLWLISHQGMPSADQNVIPTIVPLPISAVL